VTEKRDYFIIKNEGDTGDTGILFSDSLADVMKYISLCVFQDAS
jgi:hypothetical protein